MGEDTKKIWRRIQTIYQKIQWGEPLRYFLKNPKTGNTTLYPQDTMINVYKIKFSD